MSIKALFIMLLMALLANNAVMGAGSVKKQGVKPPTGKVPVVEHNDVYVQPKPFDTGISVLPENYSGVEIISFYNKLSKSIQPKDEFETTDAYNKRVYNGCPKEMFSFVKTTKYKGGGWDSFTSKYSPDDGVLTVSYGPARYHLTRTGYELGYIKLIRTNERENEYVASNAYGAKTTVSSYHGDEYGIKVINKKAFDTKEFTIKLTPDEARAAKNDVSFLIIGKIEPSDNPLSITATDSNYSSATIDCPVEYFYRLKLVCLKVYEVWVFNKKTGVIYVKQVIESQDKV